MRRALKQTKTARRKLAETELEGSERADASRRKARCRWNTMAARVGSGGYGSRGGAARARRRHDEKGAGRTNVLARLETAEQKMWIERADAHEGAGTRAKVAPGGTS